MFRPLLLGALGAAVLAGPALAYDVDYNPAASRMAAQEWRSEAPPQVPERAALNPEGPTLVASAPVPDTPTDRARFGQPMSRAGRMTRPIGD
jgi:hypothetical protein